jgi:glutaredoxin 3
VSGVRIYTTTTCRFCETAKALLRRRGVAFEEIRLDDEPGLRARLAGETGGWRSVPMIFIGDRFVGGYEDLRELDQRGELLARVEAPGP